MAEQAEWCGSPVEYIGVNDVAHMLTGTVARMGILNTERGMYRWYDCMRTEALSQNISEYNPLATILDELGVKEYNYPLTGFYIRHILNFADIIRWTAADERGNDELLKLAAILLVEHMHREGQR